MDVFLCSQWPSGICKGAKNLPTDQTGPTSDCPGSAASASALKPRYHFSGGSPEYFERAPYSNNTPGLPPTNASRFYGLAPVGNAAKQKWLYACNVVPMSKADRATVVAVPTGVTPSPYAGRGGGRPTTDVSPPPTTHTTIHAHTYCFYLPAALATAGRLDLAAQTPGLKRFSSSFFLPLPELFLWSTEAARWA